MSEDVKQLFFSNELLLTYGCVNCVFKEMDQCPHSLGVNDSVPGGYCTKVTDFMTALAEGEDSISAVKEKFHIFVQEWQALADRKEFMLLKSEYDQLVKDGADPRSLAQLDARINVYKVWWARLSDSVVKGLGKIADRETKVKVETSPKLTVQQLNVLMRDSAKKLIEVEKE
jgi:hypothetical protein